MRLITVIIAAVALLAIAVGTGTARSDGEINVYSYRQPQLIQSLLDDFTARTGIRVNVIFAKKGLLERLKAEGRNSPADILLTADVGRLINAQEAGVLRPVTSEALEVAVPARYRDPAGHWFGLTVRSRVVFAARDRVDPAEIGTYEDLADPKWRGRICTRSGKHPYNNALIASVIARNGEAAAETWLKGLKANLARKPSGNDRVQVKAVWAGVCDLAIGNTYYFGKMLEKDDQRVWAEAVNLVYPAQGTYGAHMNISGIAITRNAPNADNALALLEYMVSSKAQRAYAELNFEYPVVEGAPWSPTVADWGTFRPDELPLSEIARHRATASKLVDRTGFDAGPSS